MSDWIMAGVREQAGRFILKMLAIGVAIGLLITGIVWWLI